MPAITSVVSWLRGDDRFTDNRYARAHRWRFDGGAEVAASSSPDIVPAPMSDPAGVDPEEAFVASLSSCHMLWFLSLAARRGVVVDSYRDEAEGQLGRGADGHMMMTHVTLRPDVRYDGEALGREEEDELHHQAHEACFIAASVRSEVVIEPVTT